MTEAPIKDVICRGLRQTTPEADLDALLSDENIREALDINSYDFLRFLIDIYEETGLEIPETDYKKVFTLAGLFRYLSTHLG